VTLQKSARLSERKAVDEKPAPAALAPNEAAFPGSNSWVSASPWRSLDELNQARANLALQERKEQALVKHMQKKAHNEQVRLRNVQRKMFQALNDIRVLLSSVYSKDYFFSSIRQSGHDSSVKSLTVESMAQFFRVIIHNSVHGQNAS